MAGSLNHIVADDGGFTMDYIENMGDAWEALEECHQMIASLVGGDFDFLSRACDKINAPIPIIPRINVTETALEYT